MTNEISTPEKVQASYLELSTAAKNLNEVSDELGKTISVLEAALEKLNLGVSAWVTITAGTDESGENYSRRDLGYTDFGHHWRIALRYVRGNYSDPNDEMEDLWLFNEAPRWQRIEAIEKIPELLQKLTKQANDTAKRIQKKTAEAKELAAAIKAAAAASQPAARK